MSLKRNNWFRKTKNRGAKKYKWLIQKGFVIKEVDDFGKGKFLVVVRNLVPYVRSWLFLEDFYNELMV